MHKVEELTNAIKFIEDERNYYSGFRHVMEICVSARVINTALWNAGVITDTEKLAFSSRIDFAKTEAVKVHKGYVVALLTKSESKHTVESLVASVYNDIFY